MKKIYLKLFILSSILLTNTSCAPIVRNLVETTAISYKKEVISLNIDNRNIKVVKRQRDKVKYNDLIIFMGVTTFEKTYTTLYPYLKDINIFVIHTPLHGYDNEVTSGDSIKNADDLTSFQVKVVKELINKGHTSKKVNILGYSMGGMTLINILNKKLLEDEIDKSILMSTNRTIDVIKDENYLKIFNKMIDENKYDPKYLFEGSYSEDTPFYVKMISYDALTTTDEASLADFNCLRDFERIAKEKPMNIIDKKTLYLSGEKDQIFHWSEVEKFSKNFSNITLKKLDSGHLAFLERPWQAGEHIMNFLESN